jgi:plasmid stability protein
VISKNQNPTSIVLDMQLKKKLRILAAKKGLSLSAMIRIILDEYLMKNQ